MTLLISLWTTFLNACVGWEGGLRTRQDHLYQQPQWISQRKEPQALQDSPQYFCTIYASSDPHNIHIIHIYIQLVSTCDILFICILMHILMSRLVVALAVIILVAVVFSCIWVFAQWRNKYWQVLDKEAFMNWSCNYTLKLMYNLLF